MHDAQIVCKTPPQKLGVAHGDQEAGPPNSSAAPISATRSSLVPAIACPKNATPVVYPVILPFRRLPWPRPANCIAHFTAAVVAVHPNT